MIEDRCNGIDPAYPGLTCYLRKGHGERPCEFTDAVGEKWRRRALAAESEVGSLREQFQMASAAEDELREILRHTVVRDIGPYARLEAERDQLAGQLEAVRAAVRGLAALVSTEGPEDA